MLTIFVTYDICASTQKWNNCSQGNCVVYLVADTLIITGLGGRTVSRMSYGCTNFFSFSGRKTSCACEDGFGNATGILCSIPPHRLPRTQTPWWALHEIRASHGDECKGHRVPVCIAVWCGRTTFWIILFFFPGMVGELTVKMEAAGFPKRVCP